MPVAAVITFLAGASMAPCMAQSAGLPPTIWSKSVQTPGDNQYGNQTQNFRHGSSAPAPAQAPVAQSGGGGGGYSAPVWHPTPRPYRPDPSIEAIAADEPITPAGFPPLPDRLELPVTLGWSGSGGGRGYGGGGGYGGSGGGAGGGGGMGSAQAPGMSGGAGSVNQGMHQHYQHLQAGAYAPPRDNSGGGQQEHHSSGYYKVGTPQQFAGASSAGASDDGSPKYSGASQKDIDALGKEPRLNGKNDTATAPDAPTPVVVNQATTQDLSLPEDEFSEKQETKKNGAGKKVGNIVRRGVTQGMGMGMGMMHF
jgi:hypothetical protein